MHTIGNSFQNVPIPGCSEAGLLLLIVSEILADFLIEDQGKSFAIHQPICAKKN
jgi:hypothetical protein